MGINKHLDRSIRARIFLEGFRASGEGTAWILNGKAMDANTGTELPVPDPDSPSFAEQASLEPDGRFHLGGPGEVEITSQEFNFAGEFFEYEFPPLSVTSLVLRGEPVAFCCEFDDDEPDDDE